MRPFLLIATLLFSLASLSARDWKSASGDKTFEASYVSNDGKSVTLRKGARILTFSFDKLHADDQAWLRANHPPKEKEPAGKNGPKAPLKPAPKGAAFDTLKFGDSNKDVTTKLTESQMVVCSIPAALLARVGLNGSYRTKQTIGGLHCHLYFDWDGNNKLKEVTLRTKGKPIGSYSGLLQDNWTELINLLTILHGDAAQGAPYPKSEDLQDGLILGSHLWHTEDGHSVLLGTGQEGSNYSVVVRITSERIEANPIE
jgi:hypothetical protein